MTREVLKRVKEIEIKTKMLVDGLLQGAYHSVFKGRGIEFSEVREYAYGDDTRTIDWNVTARMNHPYVKEYIEERDLHVMLVLDKSASGYFGSVKAKIDTAIELAASIAFSAMRNNDNVGLLMFSDMVEKFVPMRKGKRHCLRLIREMITFKPKRTGSGLKKTVGFLASVLKKKTIVFIISDFMYEVDYLKELKVLRNRHDVIAMNMQDAREHRMPDIGFIELEDEETGEQILVDTSDKEFRKTFSRMMAAKNIRLKKQMSRMGVDIIDFLSSESFDIPLKRFFAMRLRR